MADFGYFGPKPPSPQLYLELYDMVQGELGVDVETISLEDRTPLCIAFAPNPDEAFYFPIDSPLMPKHLLSNPNIVKIFHNGHFDLAILESRLGTVAPIYDTVIAAQLLGLPASLNDLSISITGKPLITIESLIGKRGKNQLTMRDIPEAKIAEKCCQDAMVTLGVWHHLRASVPWDAFFVEMTMLPILIRMESIGLRIDVKRLMLHKVAVEKETAFYIGICSGLGFNPGSSKQVAAILQGRGHQIYYRKHTGNPVMNKEILAALYGDDPLAQMVLLYRNQRSLLSTFLDAILEKHLRGDRIYGRINQIATDSGRFSRSQPNLQNQPESIRDIFIPSEGCIFEDWDLNQIELRVLAYMIYQHTGDRTMLAVYDDPNGDLHAATHKALGVPNRRIAKNINFAMVYGGDEFTLAQNGNIPVAQGKAYIQTYFQHFPGARVYVKVANERLRNLGYSETILGRRRYFPDIQSPKEWERAKAEREAFNHIIQGSAAEILKRLQIRVATEPQCNTIHDEILFDLDPAHIPDRSANQDLAPFATPMKVSRGPNWKDLTVV